MMKFRYLLVAFISVVLLVSCGKEEKVSKALKKKEKEYQYLTQEDKEAVKAKKFKVKTRHTKSYFYDKYGKVAERGYVVESVLYDEDGNLTEHKFFTSRGNVDMKFEYKYDKNGNVIEKSSFDIWSRVRFKRSAEYDKYGNVVQAKEFNGKKNKYDKLEYVYDTDGNLLEEIRTGEEGELLGKTVNQYDSLGHLIRSAKFGKKGKLIEEDFYKYDSLGHPSVVKLDIPGTLPKYKRYKYDERGNVIEERMKHYIKRFAYDDDYNLVMEELFDGEENLQTKFQYFYDEKGLLKEKIRYDSFGKPAIYVKYEYEFYE